MTTTAKTAHPFRVRKQSSGYASSEKFIVVMLRPGQSASRVTTWAHVTRESAQAEADRLNIGEMVKPHAEDPRPYAERRAEAEAAYRAEQKREASIGVAVSSCIRRSR